MKIGNALVANYQTDPSAANTAGPLTSTSLNITPTSQERQANSSSSTVAISGEGLMLFRLYGKTDASSLPQTQTRLTLTNMTENAADWLTPSDRSQLASLYAYAQQNGDDLHYVDRVAEDFGMYRKFGPVESNENGPKGTGIYTTDGIRERFSFTASNDAYAHDIQAGQSTGAVSLDQGFLQYELDPGYSHGHVGNFGFLAQALFAGSLGTDSSAQSNYAAFKNNKLNNFVITLDPSDQLKLEAPDFERVDDTWVITDKGKKAGFVMENGEPVHKDTSGINNALSQLKSSNQIQKTIFDLLDSSEEKRQTDVKGL